MRVLLKQAKGYFTTLDLGRVKVLLFIRYMLIEIILLKVSSANSKEDTGGSLIVYE